jgi:single-strand DNA-binding protein
MANLNKVLLMGRCVRDPELRYTPKGTAVTELDLAVTRTWSDEQNQKQEETVFVSCTLWARPAEVAAQYLKKGSPSFVEGRLTLDSWTDKETSQKRSKLKVVGEHLQLLGTKPPEEGAPSQGPPRGSSRPAAPAASGNRGVGGPEPDDLDIPF